ncbi:MAG: hypothetical protein LAO09_01470 [Acidobacteriia bacterium]|nr:hypothetical protein [Terriglobia bacterium]
MDRSQVITIVVTAAVTAAITVVVTALTGWFVRLTQALPRNDKAVRLAKRIFNRVNILIVVSALFLGLGIYDLRHHLYETGPITRFTVVHLFVAAISVFLWFLSLVIAITAAVESYRARRN